MAQKYLTSIDLNKNQLLNAIIQNLAVEPENAKEGQIIYDSAVKKLKIYNGTEWKEVGSTVTNQDIVNSINQGSLQIEKDKIQGLTEMLESASMSGIDIVSAINGEANTSKISLEKLDGQVLTQEDKNELTQSVTELAGQVDTKDASTLQSAKTYTDEAITNLVGLASEDANTLKELEDLIKTNKDEINSMANTRKKYTTQIGDGSALSHTVNHNLHTRDVVVSLRFANTGEQVIADVVITDEDNVTVKTSTPISQDDKIQVLIIGHTGE